MKEYRTPVRSADRLFGRQLPNNGVISRDKTATGDAEDTEGYRLERVSHRE